MSRLNALRLAVAATLVAVFSGAAMIASHKSAATMQKAATQFLDSLSPDQKTTATFPFEGEERLRWHFIPNETFPRKGLMIKDMNEAQRRLAHDLLRSGLSARGYLKVTSIIELEDILKAIETYLRSRNSSMPHLPPSRPSPEAFTPPNGACGAEGSPSFTPTMPKSRASETRNARVRSRVHR